MTTWLITGASSGLGRALAGHVLATGHQVVATARNTSALESLQSAYPDTAMVAPVDVTDASSIDAAVTAAEQRFHGIDVLVNNAGYGYTAAVEEGEDEAVAHLFATDFFGPVALIKAALPGMRHREKGLIVNISSVGARITIPGGGYYSAAKAALEGLSGSLRKEVEPLGLRVMVVEPGSFRTDFRGRSADRSHVRIGAYDQVLGRTGTRHSARSAVHRTRRQPRSCRPPRTLSHRSCSSSAATRSTGSAPPLTTPAETPAGLNSSAAAPTQHRELHPAQTRS